MDAIPAIPGYHLLHCLGGGPMTVVYSARSEADDRPCAIKTLRPDWDDRATAVKLLQREARAGLDVHHPHLVHFVDVHVTAEPHYLVMDLLPGESLRARLRRDYCLDPVDAVWIGRQTAEAMAGLHRAGFLHGDVKPDNLHLTSDGHIVLIDLGFAHRPGENGQFVRRGYVLGTANYLAPELCDVEPEEELRSDLFSLGVTLFEMLAGELPFPPGSLAVTFRRHRCDPPADIGRLVPDLPDELVDLVNCLLERRPERRPSAAAVVNQLVDLEIAALRWERYG
jgi:serine/threonine protein kinase